MRQLLACVVAFAAPIAHAESCAEGLTPHTVILDRFEARDATVGDVLEALTLVVERVTKQAYKPNFIVISEGISERKVTLDLRHAPLSDALDRIGALPGVQVTYHSSDTVVFSLKRS